MTNDITIRCWNDVSHKLEVLARLHHCSRTEIIWSVLAQSLDQVWETQGEFLEQLDHKQCFSRLARLQENT